MRFVEFSMPPPSGQPNGAVPAPDFASAALTAPYRSLLQHAPQLTAMLFSMVPDAIEVCDQLNGTDDAGRPSVHVGVRKPLMGAAMADVFNEISGVGVDRLTARSLGGRTTAVIWVVDYLIDDFGISNARRIKILEQMSESISTGKLHSFPEGAQLDRCSTVLRGLWQTLKAAPFGSRFTQAFVDLAQVAVEQIRSPGSLEMSARLGSATASVVGVIPYCWKDLPARYFNAACAVGAYMQIFDDLLDRDRDKAHGIHTFATQAEDLPTVTAEALALAHSIVNQAYAELRPKERWALDCFLAGATIGSKQLRGHRRALGMTSGAGRET